MQRGGQTRAKLPNKIFILGPGIVLIYISTPTPLMVNLEVGRWWLWAVAFWCCCWSITSQVFIFIPSKLLDFIYNIFEMFLPLSSLSLTICRLDRKLRGSGGYRELSRCRGGSMDSGVSLGRSRWVLSMNTNDKRATQSRSGRWESFTSLLSRVRNPRRWLPWYKCQIFFSCQR